VVGSTQTHEEGVDVTDWPGRLAVRPGTPSDDEAVTHSRYSGRWSIYDQKEGNHMAGDDVTLPAKPIWALIQSWNAGSLSLARRFGFVQAGM